VISVVREIGKSAVRLVCHVGDRSGDGDDDPNDSHDDHRNAT
jgi:hypothetical protein